MKKPQPQAPEDLEIGDVEEFRSDKFQQFSHQALIMMTMNKCIESGCHELREGWWNEKMDRSGNIVRSYIEDTRAKFIESVKTLLTLMSCDLDEEGEKLIKKLLGELQGEKNKLLAGQWEWYNHLSPLFKQNITQKYGELFPIAFHTSFGWWQKYVELELETYRKIFSELNKLTARLDFYQAEEFVG